MTLSLDELRCRCQKQDHPRLGNWMARHVARPAALRVTRIVAPWGVSANTATLAAWTCGIAAVASLAVGTIGAWLLGAALLQVWYLLDHVDGQLARLHGTASLDGVQLDYLMHHTINLLVPVGMGCGLLMRTAEPLWALAGLSGGVALLLITLHHDARYKSFIQRLQRVRGELRLVGGGGGRPQPQPPVPRRPLRLAAWAARKACEIHVLMNTATLVAGAQWLLGDTNLWVARGYLALLAPTAVCVAVWTIARSLYTGAAEREFAAWYRPAPDHEMVYSEGWWNVEKRNGDPASVSGLFLRRHGRAAQDGRSPDQMGNADQERRPAESP